ncbi:tyrosine-type recombinase/integrase [Mucilaginibacter pallidiroseus]|uniref:Tyrosine-type recombinase/integrase n=1 Tax=Mucilaginibacter pallidiroseus TaxID=2599295 RepID=A0A563UCX1_9SPHI|nr:site-specific integrase [Mucilaginibacter pallidiroseus]TWR29170.1 tyrosine-type recombinase/integrase [Mucilaginibacter pallidiroseus]
MEKITKKAVISLYQDTRKPNAEGLCPIRIQVYYGRQRYFPTNIRLSEEDFKNSYKTSKPKGERLRELKVELQAIESKANEVVDEIKVFTFEKFEKLLYATRSSLTNIIDHYQTYIAELDKNDQTGTSSSYSCSINSIREYFNSARINPIEVITFDMITPELLNKYENWMIAMDNSRTTVGIYLRALRKIFNQAIDEGIIDKEIYPFKKYKIPTGKNTKKAIEAPDLKKLFNADTKGNIFQEKAKAFWFFSYQCNGMNIRDISELKFKDLHGTYFSFLRHKTIRTTKEDPKPIIVPITDYVKWVIEKYGNKKGKPNDYVFPIFSPGMDAKERHRVNQNFVRFINQHMKKLAKNNGMDIKGTMEARHSFTTQVTRKQGMEFAQEALGHTTLATTQNYWAGFQSETKKEMADMLMNFEEPKTKGKQQERIRQR